MNDELAGRRLHFVGIGGAGMSGLALAAHELGATVSGSDRAESSYLARLRAAGVTVHVGHAAEHVPQEAELVVSTAVPPENPELLAAEQQGLTVLHRSELLAQLASLRPCCITVAGSHGKTTTTAMASHMLTELGADPSWFVGGEVTIGARTANAHMGAGEVVVVEADESDGSFLRYRPQIAVVTNIEFEHAETWSGIDQLVDAFTEHVAAAEHVVLDADEPHRAALKLGERARSFSVSNEQADLFAGEIIEGERAEDGCSFELDGERFELGVRGEHNVKNALAAIAAVELAGFDRVRAARTLATFRGVARRFERVGETPAGAVVFDDYAHHPTEVAAALTSAREVTGGGRLVVIFQPHLYSRSLAWRRGFAEALVAADVVVVLDIYPARERAEDFPGVSGWLIATAAADHAGGRPVFYAPDFTAAREIVAGIERPGDLLLTMGAGSVTELARELTATAS